VHYKLLKFDLMKAIDNKDKNSLKFVVMELRKICHRKNFAEGILLSELLIYELDNIKNNNSAEHIDKIVARIYNLIDDLKFLIEIETRYVLFPLPEIKKEAFEMGKKYMNNFLQWIQPEYTPEKLMGILEDESYRLQEAKKIVLQIKKIKEH
jgi:hypothetical protein